MSITQEDREILSNFETVQDNMDVKCDKICQNLGGGGLLDGGVKIGR